MNGRQSLIGDEDAQAEDFRLTLPGLSGSQGHDAVQSLLMPFPMDFSKDFREEVFQSGQGLVELLGVGDGRTVRQVGEDGP